MDYAFTELQQEIKELTAQIAREKVLPHRAELDETEEFPQEQMKALADADLCGLWLPEEYGGIGGGILELCIVTEELSKVCGGVAVCYAANALGSLPIMLFAKEEQKQKYLPGIASGKIYCAFGLTEPNVGSDAGAIETTAIKDGDHYVLNGTKQWITNGGVSQVYIIIAMTNKARGARGASAFIVDRDTAGLSIGKKEKKMGIRCSNTTELHFQDCRVPAENLLNKEGRGFRVAMETLNQSRPGIGAQAVGIAQGALDEAINFAQNRRQFGQAIISFQAIQHMLADMATQIEAARVLVYHSARLIHSGDPDGPTTGAMAKMFASDMAMKVTTDALQVCGGSGYMRDYPLEKMMRDAKITQIYEGTNQIQRNVIALSLIRKARQKKK